MLPLLFLLLFNPWIFSECKVISCGGFVKSFTKVDYSKIQVKLLTSEGNLKYESECNPTNGYFMIPIYNKGTYIFRVFAPDGWIFAPDSIKVDVNGVDDPCTKGEDINFNLYGFKISGRVKSGEDLGPSQLHLGLYSSNGSLVSETATTENGEYEFKAQPGEYTISVRGEECIEKGSVPVKVLDSPVKVMDEIKISGHSLTISVQKEDGTVFPNIEVTLISDTKLPDTELPKQQQKPRISQKDGKWLYAIASSSSGLATFTCLPPGRYVVQPQSKIGNVQFSYTPPQANVVMKSEPQKINLRVAGFTTNGRVLANNLPISGATILVNGAPKTETDERGNYQLSEINEGTYTITAKKAHFEFEAISISLSTTNPNIPNVIAKGVEACGFVQMDGNILLDAYVELVHERENIRFKVKLDENGKFCRMVPLGSYTITPSSNLPSLTPKTLKADLTQAPKLDIRFTQFKATVEGEMHCLAECKEMFIELHSPEKKLTEIPAQKAFKFDDLAPDSYTLKLRGGGHFCWESDEINFKIENSNVKGLRFKQQGFAINIQSTHPASLKWKLESSPTTHGSIELKPGSNRFCVPSVGRYELSFESCHEFEQKSPVYINIPTLSPINFVGKRAKLFAEIKVTKPVGKPDLKLKLKDPNADAQMIESSTMKDTTQHFEFFVEHSAEGQEFELIPQSDTYLFAPESFKFTFNGECGQNVATFKSEIGKFITGGISASIAGVHVRAVMKSNPNKILTGETDSHGKYRIGPVWNEKDYSIEVEKEGFKFFPQADGLNFKVVKLSQLRINFLDSQTKKPLPEVLVSLSGANDYRSNNIIDSSGSINFIGLPPGEYFVRPILQEYKFEANSIPITIKEGETESITLFGERFAYSVFGKVTHLAGQPIQSVRIEAISKECDNIQEEDTTESEGTYRIRGLKPECTYRVKPALEKNSVLLSHPKYYDVKTSNSDKTKVNFVLFGFTESLEVFGTVNFDGIEMPSTLRVMLSRRLETIQEAILHSPSTLFFFTNLTIDNEDYVVSVDPNEIIRYKFDVALVHFNANSSFVSVKLHIRPQRKSTDVEVSKTSYFGMALIILLTLAFFNKEKVRPIVEQIFENARDIVLANMNRNQPPTPDEMRRRKVKKT